MSKYDRNVGPVHDHTGIGHATGIYGIDMKSPRKNFIERHPRIAASLGLGIFAAITVATFISSGALK